MKIVAHSLVPPSPLPFMHLGYVSAGGMVSMETTSQPIGYGYLITMGVTLSLVCALSLISIIRSKKGKSYTAILLLLLLAGLGALGYGLYGPGPTRYRYPVEVTHQKVHFFYPVYVNEFIERNRLSPDDLLPIPDTSDAFFDKLAAMDCEYPISEQYRKFVIDGWSRPYRLEKVERHEVSNVINLLLHSAGPDGTHGTKDDIVTPVSLKFPIQEDIAPVEDTDEKIAPVGALGG